MTDTFTTQFRQRFLRTLRVTTATALAQYDLGRRAPVAAPASAFRALAAKGVDGWRFPATGLTSSDGLLHASLSRTPDGVPLAIDLQAQGSIGLMLFAGRKIELSFALHPALSGTFDRDGRLSLPVADLHGGEDDLAVFDLRFTDDEP